MLSCFSEYSESGALDVLPFLQLTLLNVEQEPLTVHVAVLGLYPTEQLANNVMRRLEERFAVKNRYTPYAERPMVNQKQVLAFMAEHAPKPHWNRREVERTRQLIESGLSVLDDEARRKRDMPF